jgi:hypothetical protein
MTKLIHMAGGKKNNRDAANDADILLQNGLSCLQNNKIGFASAFWHHAIKLGHAKASQHLLILNNRKLPVNVRIAKILKQYQ